MTNDLVTFLRDRLDEDLEAVRLVLGVNVVAAVRHGEPAPRWVPSPESDVGVWDTNRQPRVKHAWPRERDHIIRHDPARVLAEVEAKRAIVDLCEPPLVEVTWPNDVDRQFIPGEGASWGLPVLQCLALPYADHADYRPEWRP